MPKGKKITPIDIEELENSPSLEGMLSFRDVPIREKQARSTTPVPVQPIGATPVGATPITASPSFQEVMTELALDGQPQRSRGKVIRAARVEDAHSATQDSLYWYLWRHGRTVAASQSRFIQAGYGQLQSSLGIDRSNIQDALRELQKKLSIRVFRNSTVGTATVYEVFSCEDILKRRREQGMIWVRRFGTRRADFISGAELEEYTHTLADRTEPMGARPVGAEPRGPTLPGGLTPTSPDGLPPTPPVGVAPIHSVIRATSNIPTTTIAATAKALRDELGRSDDDAARRIVSNCRAQQADATDDEIAFQVRSEAQRLKGIRGIDNLVGVLITQVPKLFEGESFRLFRQQCREKASVSEQNSRTTITWSPNYSEQELRAILEDPGVSAAEKQVARTLINSK